MSERSHARRLGFRLFIEGIEVDMVNFKVTSSIGGGATASVSIPSNDQAHKLKPRSVVHIFFFEDRYELGTREFSIEGPNGKEFHNTRPYELDKRVAAKREGKVSKLHDYKDIMNWKLLFAGEIIGYGFSKIGGLRSINLMCQDFTSYYHMAQMFWGPSRGGIHSKKKAIFLGATRLYQGGTTKTTSTSRLRNILTAKPSGQLQPSGILGGIVSLLESATGVFSPGENGKKHRGVNDMMSYAELKYHLTRTIAASDKDQTASVFMNQSTFFKWLQRVGKSIKSTASYMQFISAILPHIHYEWASLSAPPFLPGSSSLTTYKNKTINVKYKGKGDIGELIKRCIASEKEIRGFQFDTIFNKKKTDQLPMSVDAAAFDVGYTDGVRNREPKMAQLLKTTLRGSNQIAGGGWTYASILRKGKAARDDMYAKAGAGNTSGASKIRRRADQIYAAFEDAAEAAKRIVAFGANPDVVRADDINKIQVLLEKAAEAAGGGLAKPTKTVKADNMESNSRLHMTMFRPDVYMCPPPKCNVLFPDMITSIFYSRNWMSEVTRLWLFTRSARGSDRQDMYFSPNTTILGGGDKSSTERAVKERISFHMDHEKFTGIVAQFEGVADWQAMKKAYKKQIKEGGEADPRSNGYLHRAANFLFFKKRYQGRVIRLSLRYSPQLITGLPCLVLDPIDGNDRFFLSTDMKSETATKITEKVSMGTHYFGVIHSIEHVGDANGGAQTKVTLTHCRTHTESSEIFGGRGKESNWVYTSFTTKKYVGKKKVEDLGTDAGGNEYYDEDAQRVMGNDYDPKATYVMSRREGADGSPERTHFELGYRSFHDVNPEDHPSEHSQYGGMSRLVNEENYVSTVSNWVETDPKASWPSPSLEGGGETTWEHRVPAVYMDVYKRTRATRSTKATFTFEAAVTPPWYSSIFLPNKIGQEFYSDMIGCGSVIDDPAINMTPETAEKHEEVITEDSKNVEDAEVKETGETVEEGYENLEMVQIYQGFPNEAHLGDPTGEKYASVYIPKSLLQKASSASYAADNLAEAWLGLKRMRADVNVFIDTYVDRSYATMFDIFGNTNTDSYTGMDLGHKGKYWTRIGEVDGFHGHAFGLQENLDNLDAGKERLVAGPGGGKAKPREVGPEIDTRKEKFSAVMEYKRALQASTKDNN